MALTRLGSVVAAQGRLDEADQCWIAALRLQPDNPDAHRFLSQACAMRGQDALAVRHFESALATAGGGPAVMEQLATVLAGSADLQVRDAGRAMTIAERAVRLTGRQRARSLEVLSIAQAATGRVTAAVATAEEAAALARAQGDVALAARIEQQVRRLRGPMPPGSP
jgi:cytochrome c-type biogenesis protein CcmH/NrfG